MKCNVCQTDNEEHARFCRQCGTELGRPVSIGSGPLPPPSPGADPLWAQTVGSDPGGPNWTEPVPAQDPDAEASEHDAFGEAPGRDRTQQNEALPTITNGPVVRPVDFAVAQAEVRMTVAAELAARRRRRTAVLVSIGVVVALVAVVVVAVLLGGGDDGSVATDTTDLAVETTTSLLPETTIAPTSTAAPATTATTAVPTTVVATTVAPTTIAATTVPAATVPPTTAPATTVPRTTVPTTTPPPTTPPPTTATTAPTTTAAPATTAAPSTSVAVPANGDLGLDRPISKPACDGKFITLIGSSVDPDGYAIQVKSILDLYPDAKYLRTELVCSSLRAQSSAGDAIYVVFFGPFASKEQACDARDDGTDGAYVKVLDSTSNPGVGVNCGG